MPIYVADQIVEERLRAARQLSGADRFDEVWEGVYMMAPLANNEHQRLATRLATVIDRALGSPPDIPVFAGVKVSDREDDEWVENYRCPDVAVFLGGTSAKDCGTHWFGGPDFAVEVISAHDRTRDKFDFYARVGVRELLLIDRDPWQLELYRLHGKKCRLVGKSNLKKPDILTSKVLPLTFKLIAGKPRPRLLVVHTSGSQRWEV
jgi:Uma2 family endonuclease